MVNVGIAGIGFMGWIHYLAYQRVRGVKLAAVCARSEKKRAGDWRGIQGNFGPPGEQVDLSKVATYADFDEMLADPNLDVIDICYPPNLHVDKTIAALNTGKHVFCEKPMALTAADCRRMVKAAEKADRQLVIAHVLPFFAEYAYALKTIRSGKYGKVLGGYFKRVISDPSWLKDFFDPAQVGGPLIDLHVHDAHFIRMVFGMPTSVSSQGRLRGDVVEYCNTQFQFADPSLVVSAASGVVNQQGRPFTHGFEIHLERATLHYESAAFVDGGEAMPLKLVDDRGKVIRPNLGEADAIDAFVGEIKEMAKSVKSNQPSDILGGDLACDAVILCHKQTESVRRGRAVKV